MPLFPTATPNKGLGEETRCGVDDPDRGSVCCETRYAIEASKSYPDLCSASSNSDLGIVVNTLDKTSSGVMLDVISSGSDGSGGKEDDSPEPPELYENPPSE